MFLSTQLPVASVVTFSLGDVVDGLSCVGVCDWLTALLVGDWVRTGLCDWLTSTLVTSTVVSTDLFVASMILELKLDVSLVDGAAFTEDNDSATPTVDCACVLDG